MLMSVATMDIKEEQILHMVDIRYKAIEEFILKPLLQRIKCDIKGGPIWANWDHVWGGES